MTQEELEFAISQYLDGSLSADETAALEARLKDDAAARQLLEEYRKLDAMVKSPVGLPEIAWDKLGNHFCEAVAKEAEQFEFAVSQYADGTLAAEEVAPLETRLNEDARARQLLDQHRGVSILLKAPAALPEIQWDRLAGHLSGVIADAAEPRTIKLFARPWVRGFAGLAMAACLLVASAIWVRTYRARHRNDGGALVKVGPKNEMPSPDKARLPIVVRITGPELEKPQGSAVAEINIGAGSDAPGGESQALAEGIVARSPRSLIATGAPSAQDYSQMPY